MLQFDPKTLHQWRGEKVTHVSCRILSGGCEGSKIEIITNDTSGDTTLGIEGSDLLCHCYAKDLNILEGAYITRTKNTWILSSEMILTHCGCGKSFQKKTGNPKLDAFLKKRSEHEKQQGHHH